MRPTISRIPRRAGILLRLAAASLAFSAIVTAARSAQAQNFYGRSGAQFFSQCPQVNPITGGPTCTAKICGHTVNWNGGANTIAVPDLNIAPTTNYSSVANTLNALCGTNPGDGILATGGSVAVQNAQVESVAHAQMPSNKAAASGAAYGAGGVGEFGTNTVGATIPLNYTYRLSSGAAFSNVGFVSFAHQGDANQGAISGSPAYAWQIKDEQGNRIVGVAGYVPLSFAVSSVSGVNGALAAWGAGGGAIVLGGFNARAMRITYGAGGAVRGTNAGVAAPLSVLLRAEQPLDFLFHLFSTYTTVSYGNDFLNAGSEYWVLAVGAALAQYEFGYRGFYGSSYVAHSIGFSIRKDIAGAEIFELPPPEVKVPGLPAIPVPVVPPPVQLPPPPEVPTVPPACRQDEDCPGDLVCEEGQCVSPL